jgi:catechol 2,3-dioxygenase-like lactoylglutathione lyase family enzyme
MQQRISLLTLGIADFARSKRFYGEGFGWVPVFETPGIVFYQMNGLMLGRLAAAGGRMLRAADAPPHGGFRGYVADPDDHAWEIAWNPSWPIAADGRVTFGT